MMGNMKKIKDLEQTGMLRIILVLYTHSNNKLRPSEIQKSIEISNDAFYSARNRLIDLEIIEKLDDKYKTVSYFKLTEKGQKIAESLQTIHKLL